MELISVVEIRDVYTDRIPDSGLKIFGIPIWITDLDLDFLPIPDPGSRGQTGTGSWIRIRNTELIYFDFRFILSFSFAWNAEK
jgi:hypothetical protein